MALRIQKLNKHFANGKHALREAFWPSCFLKR